MKDELFNELVASVREGGAILRGEVAPKRAFVVDGPNVKRIRANFQLSQNEFAALLGISVKTVETHRAAIMKKLGISSIAELVRYAIRNRVIDA